MRKVLCGTEFSSESLSFVWDRPTDHENFVNGRTGEIITMGQCIGYVGEIHPETIEQFELKTPVAMIEMNLSAVSSLLR